MAKKILDYEGDRILDFHIIMKRHWKTRHYVKLGISVCIVLLILYVLYSVVINYSKEEDATELPTRRVRKK